jgi:hypothetical protein
MNTVNIKTHWVILLFVFVVLVSALIITGYTKPIIYDQVIAKYQLDYYPAMSYGIVPHLLTGIYNTVVHPPETSQNAHIKILAMILFMTSIFLLARAVLKHDGLAALFIVLIFLSRYPFLWLSTELIAAATLSLSIWAMIKKFHPAIIALSLALMAFTKPELGLVALVFLIYYTFRLKKSGKPVKILLISFAVFCVVLLAPGIIKHGGKYLSGENRGFFSFGQHYATLVEKHQVSPNTPDPWEEYFKYLEHNFKGAKSMTGVWLKYPLKYADFVMLSIGHGLIKGLQLFHFLWIILVGMIIFYIKKRIKPEPVEKLILLSFIGCIPFVLFAFPHIRYLARYYPLVIILILLFLQRLLNMMWKEKPFYKYALIVTIGVILVAAILNTYLFIHNLSGFDTVKDFWFPD